MTESLGTFRERSQPYPLPTYLGGEKQRTCPAGRIWIISDGPGPNPEVYPVYRGIFASTSILGSVRTVHMLILVALVTFSSRDRVR